MKKYKDDNPSLVDNESSGSESTFSKMFRTNRKMPLPTIPEESWSQVINAEKVDSNSLDGNDEDDEYVDVAS